MILTKKVVALFWLTLFTVSVPIEVYGAKLSIDPGDIPAGNTVLAVAVEELSKYLTKVTGTQPEIGRGKTGDLVAFLIGGAQTNPKVAQLIGAKSLSLESIAKQENDSYIIKSVRKNGLRYIVMAGNNDRSSLYAVYHYLERLVHVGFFFDGEYIPKKSADELPVKNIDITEQSRVLHRSATPGFPCVAALKWRNSTYWNKDDWHRYLSYGSSEKI